ncbi:MAG: helix-turn-helix transcriptional regulator [Candidatus Marinimicrobia bacterium]|jgi:putative transcriptional regulator|nr:helix-turn-helix transcriptional regulator [Candidatus Neomarinimicrobiota bacterium]
MKNNLKNLRQEKSISQDELASMLKVSRQTINSIETGKFDPSLTLAIKLTRYFEVSLEKIFIYEDEK